MFLGTPRGHKGVDDLVDAVGAIGGDVAARGGRRRRRERRGPALGGASLGPAGRRDPLRRVPQHLVAADVVAVSQRATSDTLGQVPAKLFDAMALGRPIVSTAVSMIPEILDGCGVLVPPGDAVALAGALRRLLDDPASAAEIGRRARERCQAHYSFASARAALFPVVERALAARPR